VSFHYPERRSGFDRRRAAGGALRASYLRALASYRDSPAAIGAVVVGFVVLSAADLVLTLRALEAGATEINPIMAALFESGPAAAAAFKMTLAAAVGAVIWSTRRYRRILEVSLVAFGLMAALLLYHLAVAP